MHSTTILFKKKVKTSHFMKAMNLLWVIGSRHKSNFKSKHPTRNGIQLMYVLLRRYVSKHFMGILNSIPVLHMLFTGIELQLQEQPTYYI